MSYLDKIISVGEDNLVGCWPLGESSGVTAYDLSGNGRDGTYSAAGWTYGEEGIGDGETSVLNDGTNGYIRITDADALAAIKTQEFSVMACAKVANVGVWTDGLYRYVFKSYATGSNTVEIYRYAGDNNFMFRLKAGGITETILEDYLTTVDWMHLLMTVSKSDDRVIGDMDGIAVNVGSPDLGTWVGDPSNIYIGAANSTPATPWYGWLQYIALIDRVLTPAEAKTVALPYFSSTWSGSDAIIASDGFWNAFPGLAEI